MRPNLINRLKEEWSNLDPVDPLRGLLSDAIDALAEQPAKDEFKAAYIEAMVASNEAGFAGMSAAETIRELSRMVAEQPAQQEPEIVRLKEANQAMLEALKQIKERLAAAPMYVMYASEVFDSYYQSIINAAIVKGDNT